MMEATDSDCIIKIAFSMPYQTMLLLMKTKIYMMCIKTYFVYVKETFMGKCPFSLLGIDKT